MNFQIILLTCICAAFHLIKGENVECPSEGLYYLPHSKCIQFNICFDGEVAEMTCPFGLYYNPANTQCDFPENVLECRGGTRPPISSTTIVTEEPETTTELPPGTITECGQSIIADNGTVRYKLNEVYDAGELCVFMIKFESGALNTTFSLDDHGLIDSDYNAITVLLTDPYPIFAGNLGIFQQNVSFEGYGAVNEYQFGDRIPTELQTKIPSNFPMPILGTNLAFNDETTADTLFGLSVKGWYGHEDICSNGFWIFSFNLQTSR
ncbi:putative chitinase 3 [Orchesella cincta]|uniref:Putative chitinase 3 n=1 Tax=Orchesella cincta TaxID=48709 RepID=A0A1D2M609_ORCCI|nr:putative chitinase 3 [Orchesella cincta]